MLKFKRKFRRLKVNALGRLRAFGCVEYSISRRFGIHYGYSLQLNETESCLGTLVVDGV